MEPVMPSRILKLGVLVAGLIPAAVWAEAIRVEVTGETIQGPPAGADGAAWQQAMEAWRWDRRAAIRYDGGQYARPELAWARRSFIQPQVMVEERYLYDPAAGKYTVDRYLDDLQRRYGGIDSVLIWPVYPNIGIDNRNQHDLLHDMPGGLPGLRQHGRRLPPPRRPRPLPGHALGRGHAAGRRAALGGRRPRHEGHRRRRHQRRHDGRHRPRVPQGLRRLRPSAGARTRKSAGRRRHGRLEQHELGLLAVSADPGRQQVQVDRAAAHGQRLRALGEATARDGLQSAFFNGVGYESWENVWGIWNELTPRDAEALRRIAMIERAVADLLVSPDWQPHFPTLQAGGGVYASRFPRQGPNACGCWSIAAATIRTGPQLQIPARCRHAFLSIYGTARARAGGRARRPR